MMQVLQEIKTSQIHKIHSQVFGKCFSASTHPGLSPQEPHSVLKAVVTQDVQAAGGWREQSLVQTLDVLHGELREQRRRSY